MAWGLLYFTDLYIWIETQETNIRVQIWELIYTMRRLDDPRSVNGTFTCPIKHNKYVVPVPNTNLEFNYKLHLADDMMYPNHIELVGFTEISNQD